jgi:hypothetical protein
LERSTEVLNAIHTEFCRAAKKFPKFNSAHEGYAVLLEEIDELWDEVKLNHSDQSKRRMREEAIQIGAMAMRFVIDVCDKESTHETRDA